MLVVETIAKIRRKCLVEGRSIRSVARSGLSKGAARDAVDGVFAIIGEALADGEDVRLPGFGSFGTRTRPARTGRNPRTGEAVSIPASTSPTFKAGKTLKDAVNGRRHRTYLWLPLLCGNVIEDYGVFRLSRVSCCARIRR